MTLLDHARRELDVLQAAADEDEGGVDDFQKEINRHLLAMVALFADVGHSGSSAAYSVGMLQRLLSFEPITPLTGSDDEWMEVADGPDGGTGLQQNIRCGRVFRENGIAYDIDSVVFRDRNGSTFTGWDSRRPVTFPYTPTTRVTRWRRLSRLRARLSRTLVR